jgi:hypothetical protein
MKRDNPDNQDLEVDIYINNSAGSSVASKISGYFIIKGQEFRFSAIAFGRIGGHNISLNVAKSTLNKIKKLGIDTELLLLVMQRKLIEGDVILPKGLKPPE